MDYLCRRCIPISVLTMTFCKIIMRKLFISLFFLLSSSLGAFAQDAYIGELRCVGFNFDPQNWMACEGQLLSISQYTVLFSILGTTYGGDGKTTFALPDLRGRVPMGDGQGDGLSYRSQGEMGGSTTVTLSTDQLPSHSHPTRVSTSAATTNTPGNITLGQPANVGPQPVNLYVESQGNVVESTPTTSVGSNQPHENMMPYLGLRWVICVNGIYPPRP